MGRRKWLFGGFLLFLHQAASAAASYTHHPMTHTDHTSAAQPCDTTLGPMVRGYILHLRLERNLSANTIEAYRNDLAHLEAFLRSHGLSPAGVRLEHLQQFAASLHDQGITPKSQARVLSGVRSFFRYLVIDGYISDDPTELLEWPSLGEHLPEVLSLQEIDRMEQSIDLSRWEGQRNKAIIEVLFSCGLRVSELVGLRMSALYLDDGYLRVSGKGSKERLVPVSAAAVRELRLWFLDRNLMRIKPGEDDYVFLNRRGAHLTRTMILIMVKRQAAAAGITKTLSPHTLRHSFATELLRGGADLRAIQAMPGHESIAPTQIYTHISNESPRQAILAHHPRHSAPRDG